MNISIGDLNITDYCTQNPEHVKFRWDLIKDRYVYEFVSTTIGNDLQEIESNGDIELGNSYIIEDNNKPVGYIYVDTISEEEGIVELRYAVHPEFRRLGYAGYSTPKRRGYGQQILEECRDYLFTFDDVKEIELDIRVDNSVSMRCANKAKYKCLGLEPEGRYYIYRFSKESERHEN